MTTNDKERQRKTGGLTPDDASPTYAAVLFAIAESPIAQGLIWVGTDDGKVQVTRDGGASWTDVTGNFRGLPPASWVSRIEASRADAGTAYAAFDRHRLDDPAPYVFKTTDYGKSWFNITGELPPLHYVHVIREDPRNPNLVYVGTEMGLFASWQGGGRWSSLRLNLPPVAVRDILVHPRDNDLIIGTHGRSLWILDDITPLQELEKALGEDAEEAHLFPPRAATRFVPWKKRFRADIGDRVFVGENPPYGALITYYLKEDLEDGEEKGQKPKVRIEILGEGGALIRGLEGPGAKGLHRIAWDLRHEPMAKPEDKGVFALEMAAPLVLPGGYTVKMKVGDRELTAPVEVRLRSSLEVSAAELRAQHEALLKLLEMAQRGTEAVRRIDDVVTQLEAVAERLERKKAAPEELVGEAKELTDRLKRARQELTRPREAAGYRSPPRLLEKIGSLSRSIGAATAPPTEAQSEWLGTYSRELEKVLESVRKLMEEDVPALGRRMDAAGVPRIVT